jgi:hypothetical protein
MGIGLTMAEKDANIPNANSVENIVMRDPFSYPT